MSNAIQSLWQHQEPPLSQMAPSEFRRRADQALSEDRRHKAVGLVTALILVVSVGLLCFVSQTVMAELEVRWESAPEFPWPIVRIAF